MPIQICRDFLRVAADPAVGREQPTIRGLRYTVESVLELLAAGMTVNEVLADYPDLERDDLLPRSSSVLARRDAAWSRYPPREVPDQRAAADGRVVVTKDRAAAPLVADERVRRVAPAETRIRDRTGIRGGRGFMTARVG